MIFARRVAIIFLLLCGYTPLFTARIYETDDQALCPKHFFWYIKCVKCAETVKRCAHLIPGSDACKKYVCHQCGEIPWEEEFVLDDDEELLFVDGLSCRCKEALYGHLGDDFGGHWAEKMPSWSSCNRLSIYRGYLEDSRYIPLFAEYLCFVEENPCCIHLWPELSSKAAGINSAAYDLFYQLITTTALKCLVEDRDEQYNFLYNQTGAATTTARLLVSHAFFFSSYEFICRDLENYSNYQFHGQDLAIIRDQLHLIRETLAPLFLDLYKDCPPGCQAH